MAGLLIYTARESWYVTVTSLTSYEFFKLFCYKSLFSFTVFHESTEILWLRNANSDTGDNDTSQRWHSIIGCHKLSNSEDISVSLAFIFKSNTQRYHHQNWVTLTAFIVVFRRSSINYSQVDNGESARSRKGNSTNLLHKRCTKCWGTKLELFDAKKLMFKIS